MFILIQIDLKLVEKEQFLLMLDIDLIILDRKMNVTLKRCRSQ